MYTESQRLHEYMTPDGVMKLSRTPQGCCHILPASRRLLNHVWESLVQTYLPDWMTLPYSIRPKQILSVCFMKFLQLEAKHWLVVSLPMSTFHVSKIRWCGGLIDSLGFMKHSSNYEDIKNVYEPETVCEICLYVNSDGWMIPGVPIFAKDAHLCAICSKKNIT